MIMDRSKNSYNKSNCSIDESQCFAFFDEFRTRGSDLKLNKDCHGLVTINPKTTKDLFMQAVGRLRKFGHDQYISVVYNEEMKSVLPRSPTVMNVLERIVNTSIKYNQDSLLAWAIQGMT